MDFRGFVANMAESASAQQLHSLQDLGPVLKGDGLVQCNSKIFLETLAVGKQQSCMRTDDGGRLSNI